MHICLDKTRIMANMPSFGGGVFTSRLTLEDAQIFMWDETFLTEFMVEGLNLNQTEETNYLWL